MKKKTAIILGALALLAAGATFHGIKIKDRKEKEKIENKMKELLASNVQEELDEFRRENRKLEKYIAYYDAKIQELAPDSLISKSEGDKLRRLVSDMYKDWKRAIEDFMDEYKDIGYKHYDGELPYFQDDALPKSAQEQMKYLCGGMLKKYHDEWEPGVFYKDIIGRSSPSLFDAVYVDRTFYYMTEFTLRKIESRDITTQDRAIKELMCFVDNIDNSGGVIKPKTLSAMRKMLAELSQKGNFEKRQELEKEKHPFEVAKGKVEWHMARNNDMRYALGQMQQQVEK